MCRILTNLKMSVQKNCQQSSLIHILQEKLYSSCRPLIMGVLNVTPDSFSDGGRFLSSDSSFVQKTLEAAQCLIADGADIIDIGGESTRPGALPVTVVDELARVIPVVQACAAANIPVSVDTSKAEVMKACLDIGIVMINDVAGFRGQGVLDVLQDFHCYRPLLCIMHMKGSPRTMQAVPEYECLYTEIRHFFEQRIQCLFKIGVQKQQIVLDPGFGFGKNDEHNWALLANLQNVCIRELPMLAGLSRKSMFGRLLGRDVDQRVAASLASVLIGGLQGVRIMRVHDVAQTYDVLRVLEKVEHSRSHSFGIRNKERGRIIK